MLPSPVGYNRAYVRIEGERTYEKWWDGLRAGRVFVANGPLLRCRADGQWPGHVFQATAGRGIDLQLEVALDSLDPIKAIEIIQNGRVIRTIPGSAWNGVSALGSVRFDGSGWFLVRVLADVPDTFRFASTGPFYVEV